MIRSYLFTPAHQERFIARSHERGAGAVLLDLEDSVPLDQKAAARAMLPDSIAHLSAHNTPAIIRVNRDLANCAADLRAATLPGVAAVMLPKVAGPDHVGLVDEFLSECEREAGLADRQIDLIALIETPEALLKAHQIAVASPRLTALALGTEDFATACGFLPNPRNLFGPSQQTIIAARSAGLMAIGLPGSIAEVSDVSQFADNVRQARSMGFDGVLCIHPKQVTAVNEAFIISDEELLQARRIVTAYEQALLTKSAAVQLDGKMIDAPIVERAQALLASADRQRTPA